MKIAVDTAGQEDRMFLVSPLNPPYTGPARSGSVFNVGNPVIVVDLTEDVDGDDVGPNLMEHKGEVVDVNDDDEFSVLVMFAEQVNMWFKDCELAIDEAALLEADETARREYVA